MSSFFFKNVITSMSVIESITITFRDSINFVVMFLVYVVIKIVPFWLCKKYVVNGRLNWSSLSPNCAPNVIVWGIERTSSLSKLSRTNIHVPLDSSQSHLVTNSNMFSFGSLRPRTLTRSVTSRYPYSIRSLLLIWIQNTHVWGDRSRRRWQYSMTNWDLL